jgi:hypothetical protein
MDALLTNRWTGVLRLHAGAKAFCSTSGYSVVSIFKVSRPARIIYLRLFMSPAD